MPIISFCLQGEVFGGGRQAGNNSSHSPRVLPDLLFPFPLFLPPGDCAPQNKWRRSVISIPLFPIIHKQGRRTLYHQVDAGGETGVIWGGECEW